jgi:hypothetical protein
MRNPNLRPDEPDETIEPPKFATIKGDTHLSIVLTELMKVGVSFVSGIYFAYALLKHLI